MWSLLVLNFILCHRVISLAEEDNSDDRNFGGSLITQLKDDANLDLSQDEEYEDLRAELLAYHTTLAKLASASSRRSMRSTPCWQIGGICINYKLCSGFRYLTEVAGCRDNLNVCCFTWNRYKVSDFKDHGISGLQYPWSVQKKNTYGQGKGLIVKKEITDTLKKNFRPKLKPKPITKSNLKPITKPNPAPEPKPTPKDTKPTKEDKTKQTHIEIKPSVEITDENHSHIHQNQKSDIKSTEEYAESGYTELEQLKSTKKVHFSEDVKKEY